MQCLIKQGDRREELLNGGSCRFTTHVLGWVVKKFVDAAGQRKWGGIVHYFEGVGFQK